MLSVDLSDLLDKIIQILIFNEFESMSGTVTYNCGYDITVELVIMF